MFKKFYNLSINTMYPDEFTCNFCGDEIFADDKNATCDKCKSTLPFCSGNICKTCGDVIENEARYCESCKYETRFFKFNHSAFLYDDKIANAIRQFKFDNAKYWYSCFAGFLFDVYKKYNYDCDIICYVPMHQKRQRQRGYNQSELIATRLGELLNIKVSCENLVKIKDTKNQVDLNFKQRKENLCDAFFVIDKSEFKNKNVLLVDDVYTTGSTLNNCALKLKKAGAKEVYCLTVAHAHQKN